jgi:hypothetical protein
LSCELDDPQLCGEGTSWSSTMTWELRGRMKKMSFNSCIRRKGYVYIVLLEQTTGHSRPESSTLRLMYAALPDPWFAETASNLTTYAELDMRQRNTVTDLAVLLAEVVRWVARLDEMNVDETEIWMLQRTRADALACFHDALAAPSNALRLPCHRI